MMKGVDFKEFRPTLIFLGKFLSLYLLGNLLYGLYVTRYSPSPDPATRWVSAQTGMALTACGWSVVVQNHATEATSLIRFDNRSVLSVYEGCNGINTMIIFAAFVLAFGPIGKKTLWFIPLGILIIHAANILRIGLLFVVAELWPDAMYLVHKYLFTAFLYFVIFVLWTWWVSGMTKSEPQK